MFIKMNKRQSDGSIEKQEKHVLQLAERGDFAVIAELLNFLELNDAVVCELIRIHHPTSSHIMTTNHSSGKSRSYVTCRNC